jgi:hypothetical protein
LIVCVMQWLMSWSWRPHRCGDCYKWCRRFGGLECNKRPVAL